MAVAYFISVHELPKQFYWLFEAIYNPFDIFVIHVDKRACSNCAKSVEHIVSGFRNVHLLPAERITWGGWSVVEMNVRAIQRLCSSQEHWTHFVNLSGQDYPLRPVSEFREFLRCNQGMNFVQSMPIATQPFHIRRRLRWYCFESNAGLRRIALPNLRAMFAPIEWYGGLWCILSREFCEWMMKNDEEVDRLRRALRYTKIPDEFFFQSLINRSAFARSLDHDPRRFIRFEDGSPHPRTLTYQDLDDLLASSDFFARKFDERVDSQVLKAIAHRIAPHRQPRQAIR
jgi:hypothetical protein